MNYILSMVLAMFITINIWLVVVNINTFEFLKSYQAPPVEAIEVTCIVPEKDTEIFIYPDLPAGTKLIYE